MCICVHINIKTYKQENNKTLKVVRVTLRQSVLPLSVPLWAAWHTNVELIQRRTMFCFTSIDVGVLHALVAGHDGKSHVILEIKYMHQGSLFFFACFSADNTAL